MMTATHLALLRGINVGGKNKLPMKDVAAMFAEAGCEDVRTYIQSGNVLFNLSDEHAERLPGSIAEAIARSFGYRTPVVVRTVEQLRGVVDRNPFLEANAATDSLHVMFLADLPERERLKNLDPERSPPDVFVVVGREVYLRLPNGVATTKLSNAYFDSKLATICTGRNWRTVTKLLELMGG